MTEPTTPGAAPGNAGREEMLSALFAQMILQQSNMAMMLLGKVPHPQSGETIRDVEAAGMFIDQLEMLEAKTRGNLSTDEERLLKQSLMSLRLAFVEAVETSPAAEKPEEKAATPPTAAPAHEGSSSGAAGPVEEESRKKFSKKY